MKRTRLPPRTKPLPRGKQPKRSRIKPTRKPKAETDAKFAREFGSAERVAFVASLPCIGCGKGPCENHHISTAGMGRRAHHSLIVPLCKSCHLSWHAFGRHTFCDRHHIVAAVEAERIAKAWYLHAHGQPFHDAPE